MKVENHLTIDVEEYFEQAPPEVARNCESRLERQMDKLLHLLDDTGNRATFFFLARLAVLHPEIVKRVSEAGHRIGCHGDEHSFFDRMPFEKQVEAARRSLETVRAASPSPVESFRAPFFSVNRTNCELLRELSTIGVRFDCSVFPGRHPDYGWPGTPVLPYRIGLTGCELVELPVTTASFLGLRFGVGGGGWLRMIPWFFTRGALRSLSNSGRPLVIYLHPWELDSKQPRLKLGMRFPWRHYLNLSTTEKRFREILTTYRFVPVEEVDTQRLPVQSLESLCSKEA